MIFPANETSPSKKGVADVATIDDRMTFPWKSCEISPLFSTIIPIETL